MIMDIICHFILKKGSYLFLISVSMIMDIICHFILKNTRNFGLFAVTKICRMEFHKIILSCVFLTCFS